MNHFIGMKVSKMIYVCIYIIIFVIAFISALNLLYQH